jgi:hypothetical protein
VSTSSVKVSSVSVLPFPVPLNQTVERIGQPPGLRSPVSSSHQFEYAFVSGSDWSVVAPTLETVV